MNSTLSYLTPKSETFYIDANSSIRQALEKFDYHKFSVVPLISKNGKYVGTLSEGDILRYIKNNSNFDLSDAEKTKVKDIERYRSYKTLSINTPVIDVLKLSMEQNFIPMVDDRGIFIGIIKRKSLLNFLFEKEFKL